MPANSSRSSGLNGAGKTTLFNAISGLLPYAGDIRREGASLRGQTAATIARNGIVQCPEGRELFIDMTVRENLDLGGQHLPPAESAEQIAWLFELFPDPARAAEAGRRHAVRRRAADADHRARADDEAEAPDPRRADAGPGAGHPRADFQGAGTPAADHRRSPCCSASRTSPSRCRTPTASMCSNTRASSGKAGRPASPPKWARDICKAPDFKPQPRAADFRFSHPILWRRRALAHCRKTPTGLSLCGFWCAENRHVRSKRNHQEISRDSADGRNWRSMSPQEYLSASDPVSIAQPAGRDFPRSEPPIEGDGDNSRGLEDRNNRLASGAGMYKLARRWRCRCSAGAATGGSWRHSDQWRGQNRHRS